MRALLTVLMVLSPLLLPGCERPDPERDYRIDPKAAQTGDGTGFQATMANGTRANLAGRPADAMKAFRSALETQIKRYGRGHPETALPLMSLALQLSVEGQFPEAETRFAEADIALRGSKDRAMKARLLHYRGMHALNQNQPRQAVDLLNQAQAGYTSVVPAETLERDAVARASRNRFDPNSSPAVGFKTTGGDERVQPALLGLIEVLRYQAIALRQLGRGEEAAALTDFAARIAGSNDLGRASVYARVYRTSGLTASARSFQDRALSDLGRSDDAFEEALPGTRPAAEAKLIRGAELMRAGRTSAALSVCRRAVKSLIAIRSGTSPELMAPCLEAYAAGGLFSSRSEMFTAAQIAQGTITSKQIAQASAALQENARDPRVGPALKQRDDLQRTLDLTYRRLDGYGAAAATGRVSAEVSRLQQEAEQIQAALTQAEANVRQLSPNYGQLVQDVVPASDIFALLHPNEVFVALILSQHGGWTFALRNGDISVAKIEGGSDTIGPLVKQVRAGIEVQNGQFDIAATRRLYDVTLGGVADKIQGAKSIVIAPTGALLSVPFEVLLTGPADPAKLEDAPWLLRQATITHVPAPTNFVSLRRVAGTSAAAKPWFGFGDFRRVSAGQAQAGFPEGRCGRDRQALTGLPALPGATQELRGAQAILGAGQGDALTADQFTAERVMAQDLKPYQILHFAAHALLPTDLECQTEAAIVTSPGRGTGAGGWLLTSSRLLGLELDANLVILSACNSGGGDGKSGESLSGLARSFFFARARSLMITHWPVHDQFGSALVQLTVAGMKKTPKSGVTGALRDAQMEIFSKISEGKVPSGYAHPFFWAPFAVIGEGGEGMGRSTVSSLQ